MHTMTRLWHEGWFYYLAHRVTGWRFFRYRCDGCGRGCWGAPYIEFDATVPSAAALCGGCNARLDRPVARGF